MTHTGKESQHLAIGQLQIKTTRYHFTLNRIGMIKKTNNHKCWQGCGEIRTLIHCDGMFYVSSVAALEIYQFFKRLNRVTIAIPISLFGIYTRELKTHVYTKMLTQIIHYSSQAKCGTTQMSIN